MVMFESAHARLDEMIGRATRRLHAERRKGYSDAEFLEALIGEFSEEAQRQPHGAGAFHMALSIHRMVTQQEEIHRLTQALDMAHQGLELMFKLSDDRDNGESL
jgi:hypothetical protein